MAKCFLRCRRLRRELSHAHLGRCRICKIPLLGLWKTNKQKNKQKKSFDKIRDESNQKPKKEQRLALWHRFDVLPRTYKINTTFFTQKVLYVQKAILPNLHIPSEESHFLFPTQGLRKLTASGQSALSLWWREVRVSFISSVSCCLSGMLFTQSNALVPNGTFTQIKFHFLLIPALFSLCCP